MKRRRDLFTRIVAAAMAVAVILFAAVSLYQKLAHPFAVVRAASMTVRKEITALGYIARDEQPMSGSVEYSAPELRNGEKAYAGALIATLYPVGADEATLARVRECKQRISALRDTIGRGEAEHARQCEATVRALTEALAAGDYNRANELSIAAESMLSAQNEYISAEAEISRLEKEVAALTAMLRGGTGVYAPKSGIVSHMPDGFEQIKPEDLKNASPSELRGMFVYPGNVGSCAVVYGVKWYLAVIMPATEAGLMRERNSVRVAVPRLSGGEYIMGVESVSIPENGECVVTLSCDARISETFGQRAVTAHILFGEDSGYALPKQAVRLDDDGQTHIYIAVSRSAVRLDVDILRELGGDAYLVTAKTDYGIKKTDEANVAAAKTLAQTRNIERSAYLRDGSEIVTHANELADGKVLR